MNDKILVIAAHPDDEVLGCGGTVSQLAEKGSEVYIAIMGEGVTSRYEEETTSMKEELENLKESSKKAASLLKAKKVVLFDFPDNKFDTVPLLYIVKKIEELIDEIRPSVIFTHHAADLNIDHRITNQAVLTATRPVKGMIVREIYMFEIPSSTEWTFGKMETSFSPNVFYDIGETIDLKIKAMETYCNEMREFPHPRSSKAILANAERWGSVVGAEKAEAFELLRSVR